jgi:sulfide dehydrogenase cytochrome subunit
MRKKKDVWWGIWFALLATPAWANPASGELLANGCMACHGLYGKSGGKIPSLNHTDPAALATAMKAFRSGQRPSTIMGRIASGYSDTQIDELATYFSTKKGKR